MEMDVEQKHTVSPHQYISISSDSNTAVFSSEKASFTFAEHFLTKVSAKPTQGVWGLAPKNQVTQDCRDLHQTELLN
jgi:hypothetical protein